MARTPAPLPATLGPHFSRRAALEHGVSPWRLARADIEHPFRGAHQRHVIAAPQMAAHSPNRDWCIEHRNLAEAYATVMHHDNFFTGITAALLWALPVPLLGPADIEVGCFAPRRQPQAAGVRGRVLQPGAAQVTEHRGLRLTTPASTWASLGSRLALKDLVALGDQVVRVPRFPGNFRSAETEAGPLASIAQLHATLSAGRRVGNPALRQALALIRTGSSSAPESHLRLHLVSSGFPEPELDFDVRDAHGTFLGCSELVHARFRVAYEYEGEQHRVDRAQWNRDIQKYRDYADADWEVIRVTAHLLYRQPRELTRQTETALRRRGWRPGSGGV